MRVLGTGKLEKFSKIHANCRSAISAWKEGVEKSEWQTSHGVKSRYPSASILSDNRVIFNLKGNKYRLVVKVRYEGSTVVVLWVGTHAEYDKETF